MGRTKSLAEQIAELENPAPKDVDPEDHGFAREDDEISGSEDEDGLGAREHYEDVGESKLRQKEEISLGPQYKGAKVSREALHADESDEDPFAKMDSERRENEEEESDVDIEEDDGMASEEEGEQSEDESDIEDEVSPRAMKASAGALITNGDLNDEQDERDEEPEDESDFSDEDDEDDDDEDQIPDDESNLDDEDSDEEDAPKDDRAELRRLMADEQKAIVSNISQAAAADASKGRAVKEQRATFDTLLNIRIRLQKALVSTNSLPASANQDNPDTAAAVQGAEHAALRLWKQLDDLRHDLLQASATKAGTKRKRASSPTPSTPSVELWTHMRDTESLIHPTRAATLDKWSTKVRGASAPAAPRGKLGQTNSTHQQPLTTVLTAQLTGNSYDRLLKRTRTPRSCAPVQANAGTLEAPEIYDDADFYQLLLRELVEQRMAASSDASAAPNLDALPTGDEFRAGGAMRAAKIRREVDTRASKGRKMRYTVHEKLQNFMAPEDRGTWGQRQVDELFGSLLGKKMVLAEEEEGEGSADEDEDMGLGKEEEGLRLFRS